jgi:hypothetical protein
MGLHRRSPSTSSVPTPPRRLQKDDHAEHLTQQQDEFKKPTRLKKSVSFDSIVRCRETFHFNDLLGEERQSFWRTADDKEESLNEVWDTIEVMNAAIDELSDATTNLLVDDESLYCTRGLEGHTKVGEDIRKENRNDAISAVLEAQASGVTDPQVLAAIYRRESQHTQTAAYLMARFDEQATTEEQQEKKKDLHAQDLLPSSTFQELLQNLRQGHASGNDFATVLSRHEVGQKRRQSQLQSAAAKAAEAALQALDLEDDDNEDEDDYEEDDYEEDHESKASSTTKVRFNTTTTTTVTPAVERISL